MKEMVGGCCVCSDESGWTENPLVYCDGQGCNVAVHQACYGIVRVPTGPWFCRKCELQEKSAKVKCELCPSGDGALKKTDNSGWAHVVCALYIPEVRFGNVTAMEPIILQLIPQERYNKSCYLCEEQGKQAKAAIGACMQCNKTGCKQNFHVTCAQAAGLLCEEAGNYSDNVKYTGYCLHHYQKLKKTSSIKIVPAFKPLPSAIPDLTSEKSKNRTEINGQSTSSSIAGSSSPDSKSKMNDSTDSVITHTSNLLQSDSRKRKRSKSESTSSSSTEPSSELGDGSSVYNTNTSDQKDSSLTANLEGYSASNNLPNGVTAKKIRLSDENNKKKQKKILRKAKTDNALHEKKNHKRGGLNIQMVENTHASEDHSKPPVLKIQMETNATKTKRHMNVDHHSVASTSSTSVHGLVGPSVPRARRNSCKHPKFPQTLEQLLEHHWEQGSQFMMEQSQNFDVASLLSCLHQLRQENTCLEDHVNSLASRRDHLLAVNARLSVPLAHSYKQQKL